MWTQHVNEPTRLDSLLDLVITSNPDMVDEVKVQEKLGKSDHSILTWDTTFFTSVETEKPKRGHRRANFQAMKIEVG